VNQPNLFNDTVGGVPTAVPELKIGMTLYTKHDLDREARAAAENSAACDGLVLTRRKPVWTLVIRNAGSGTEASLIVVYRTTEQHVSASAHTTSIAI